MTEEEVLNNKPKTLAQFSDFLSEGKLMCVACECGTRTFLIAPSCQKCGKLSQDHAKWEEVTNAGTIETYSVVYVGPPVLQDLVPYCSVLVNYGEFLSIAAILNEKIDPMNPPTDLIGKTVKPSFIQRPDEIYILGANFAD